MTIPVSSIMQSVGYTIQDPSFIRWGGALALDAMNEAHREIVRLKADACIKKQALVLVSGVRQTIPTAGLRLISIIGNTGGTAVYHTDESTMSRQYPGWTNEQAATSIQAWMFDDADPKAFLVYPKAAATGASLDIIYSSMPDAVTDPGNIALGDEFRSSIEAYMVYKALSANTSLADAARAAQFYQLFLSTLGMSDKADAEVNPNRRINVNK